MTLEPTPGTELSCGWMKSSLSDCSCVSGWGPDRMILAIASALKSTLLTVGTSASAGSRLRTPLTTRCTSTDTWSGFAALENWTVTIDTLKVEMDVSQLLSILGRTAIASSMGLVTLVSTVSGSAPGYAVVTTTAAMFTLGVTATPNVKYANSPNRHSPTVMPQTTSGLRSENSVIMVDVSFRAERGISPV